MTPREFCYWLQGYFELTLIDYEGVELSEGQTAEVNRHLQMVFNQEPQTTGFIEEGNKVVFPPFVPPTQGGIVDYSDIAVSC